DSAERVSQVVQDNPWQTAGVVAGLAFAAGLLLARR
ncbi:glycine zipper domain-containing protein, partial [Burkholderia gladioli]